MGQPWDTYLAGQDKTARLGALKQLQVAGQFLPIFLSEDLLCMNLDADEKSLVLDLTASSNNLEYEHFLTAGASIWDQNLAALALRKWASHSDHLLWFRLLSMMSSPILAQRLRYTILDLCPFVYGKHLLELLLKSDGIADLSPAFHGLLINRCLQWNYFTPQVDLLAKACLQDLHHSLWPDHKAMPAALTWLQYFAPEELVRKCDDLSVPSIWRDHLRMLAFHASWSKKEDTRIAKAIAELAPGAWPSFYRLWPGLGLRQQVSPQLVATALSFLCQSRSQLPWPDQECWELFTGIPEAVLFEALGSVKDGMTFANSIRLLQGLLPIPPAKALVEQAVVHLTTVASPHDFLAALSPRFRLGFHSNGDKDKSAIAAKLRAVLEDEKKYGEAAYSFDLPLRDYSLDGRSEDKEDQGRSQFFQLAYKGRKLVPAIGTDDHFWSLLTKNWYKPCEADLAKMALVARQAPKLYQICYIHTLARFAACDAAALKLLDYIRTTNENELQEVIQALGGIGTPRAMQELIAAITRPNVTPALQLEICQILQGKDLHALQGELRSAIEDLHALEAGEAVVAEVKESLIALLSTEGEETIAPTGGSQLGGPKPEASTQQDLDAMLTAKIPHFMALSSEVRRALRTAQFFNSQVERNESAHAIDLSPVIDMQYKALELIFRECFEEASFRLVNQGVLQRKLDVIGYARPIPRAMDDFENYIGGLPIIKEIPYFSKFKLRKLLRAICQYRPGRRFTLDGIKAFALFFLCFGRKKCPYGLNEIIPLGFNNDLELAEFCRLLHIFQDFRNRAAHEGFRPEARNDVLGIWQTTAQIISIVYQIKGIVQLGGAPKSAASSGATVISSGPHTKTG